MKKIVLVDDMEISNFIISTMIENIYPGYVVHDFTNPVQAFSSLNIIEPDAILLDLNMPEMDGWAFLDSMQSRNMSYQVHILTSSTSELDRRRSLTYSNVISYQSKPLDEKELVKILQ
ncbi:response regulator [Pontibacter silvestris]|uniref:Response regulator n=1 Tax=Pontibacter silvestris TaxID=2305183 RepID=A0ABW4WZU8_9BACT|nr:response regulator [Pontibacter silvestris]MCC9135476.1 response regulator [Pontibacter silvestris]